MKLNSNYLNPFQPFPERDNSDDGNDAPSTAIEDNLSRSVISALANAEDTIILVEFLQALSKHGSPRLREGIEKTAEAIRSCKVQEVEFSLQTWPREAMKHRDQLNVVLIGVSSSHQQAWTYDQRKAPSNPRPDAWVYVPQQALIAFEFKNDDHALDATQISAYAHELGLLQLTDNVPRAKPDCYLESAGAAKLVQDKCRDLVLDVPWSAVAETLHSIAAPGGSRGRWLCGQAATHIGWHIRPPYRGPSTILTWLKGPDTPDRREHLRTLVGKLGDSFAKSEGEDKITFTKNDAGRWNIQPDVEPGVYVNLRQSGQPLQSMWLGRTVEPVLWFAFTEIEGRQRIGLSYYLQASGSQANGKGEAAWNRASSNHLAKAEPFEQAVEEWCHVAAASCLVTVEAVKFKGKKRNWQSGGNKVIEGPGVDKVTPVEALAFLKKRREELWRFPRIGAGQGEVATIEEAAGLVRKPAISLQSHLDFSSLANCGEDIASLQNLLKNAVASISTQSVSNMNERVLVPVPR